jgi:hypothetical protein
MIIERQFKTRLAMAPTAVIAAFILHHARIGSNGALNKFGPQIEIAFIIAN